MPPESGKGREDTIRDRRIGRSPGAVRSRYVEEVIIGDCWRTAVKVIGFS